MKDKQGNPYVPIYFDWLEQTQDLDPEEKGNLIDAVILYASGHECDHLLNGGAKIAFRFLKGQIDRNDKISAIRSKASKGADTEETETNGNKPEQNGTNRNKTEQTVTNTPKEKEKEKEKEKDKESSSFMDDADAAGIQREHDQVLNAAESAGFPRTDAVRAKLLNLYAENGLQKMLDGINACVDYGVTTIAYLTAVLKGEPKKAKTGKTVSAQQYSQRDYSDEDQEAFRRMMIEGIKAEKEAEKRKTG